MRTGHDFQIKNHDFQVSTVLVNFSYMCNSIWLITFIILLRIVFITHTLLHTHEKAIEIVS